VDEAAGAPRVSDRTPHKFKIGQSITWQRDPYRIIGFLPPVASCEPEYRVRHSNNGQVEVAKESQLRPAAAP
jgi:hypothetical protein